MSQTKLRGRVLALPIERVVSPRGQLVSRRDAAVLDRVVRTRNDFEHSRLKYDSRAIESTIAFLRDGRAACGSQLFDALAEM
jgi:hypothetical protein